MRRLKRACLLVAVAALGATPATASSEIGAAAAAAGAVEVRRASAGDWKALAPGAPIFRGDELRTGEDGRLKILFSDDTVLDLSPSTTLAVKDYPTPGAKGDPKTLLGLSGGRVRALLGDARGTASHEVETPTAVVRADEGVFIVGYDAAQKSTEVVGIEGSADVQGAIGLIGPSIKVASGERTEVQEGKFPVPVAAIAPADLAAAQAAVEIIGSGQRDGLAADDPILRGAVPRSDERPGAISPTASAGLAGGSYLEPGAPGETLRDRLSPALRANTQPVLEYKFAAPDEAPPQ